MVADLEKSQSKNVVFSFAGGRHGGIMVEPAVTEGAIVNDLEDVRSVGGEICHVRWVEFADILIGEVGSRRGEDKKSWNRM